MRAVVRLGSTEVLCSLALSPEEHAVGLQKHARLEANEGLLFLFDEVSDKVFHMGAVPFPIDIIGIGPDRTVARVAGRCKPGSKDTWRFRDVDVVLEVPGGFCEAHDVYAGTPVEIVPATRTAVIHGAPTDEGFPMDMGELANDGIAMPSQIEKKDLGAAQALGNESVDRHLVYSDATRPTEREHEELGRLDIEQSFDQTDIDFNREAEEGARQAPKSRGKARSKARNRARKMAMPMPSQLPPGWRIEKKRGAAGLLMWELYDEEDEEIARLHVRPLGEKQWEVSLSHTEVSGWGAYLYEQALDWASAQGGWIEADQSVSRDAADVWMRYYQRSRDPSGEVEAQRSLSSYPRVDETGTAWDRVPEEDEYDPKPRAEALRWRYRKRLPKKAVKVCPECHEEGLIRCPACTDDDDDCPDCGGDGMVGCPTCDTRGVIPGDADVIPFPKRAQIASEGELVLYHGSDTADIELFEGSTAGPRGYFGSGLYTSPNFEEASFYGNFVYEGVFKGAIYAGDNFETLGTAGGRFSDKKDVRFRVGDVWYTTEWCDNGVTGVFVEVDKDRLVQYVAEKVGPDVSSAFAEWASARSGARLELDEWDAEELLSTLPSFQEDGVDLESLARDLSNIVKEGFEKARGREFLCIDHEEIGNEIRAAGYDAVWIPGLERNHQQTEVLIFDPNKFQVVKVHDTRPPAKRATRKKAQIVDEGKFVEKMAAILIGKPDMEWHANVINGGATERLIVSKGDLRAWLEPHVSNSHLDMITRAASDQRGLSLIGDAFILAGLADQANKGFSGREEVLVLYRKSKSDKPDDSDES